MGGLRKKGRINKEDKFTISKYDLPSRVVLYCIYFINVCLGLCNEKKPSSSYLAIFPFKNFPLVIYLYLLFIFLTAYLMFKVNIPILLN